MVAIVYQTDKRSGITYAYESISHWDKEKQQSRARRTLIGRVDKITGEIVPTDGRNRKKREAKLPAEQAPKCTAVASRSFFGATYLFDAIGEKLSITKDLKQCFPDTYQQILSIAYYLILEESAPLYRFDKWGTLHKHPYEKNISSERASDLFSTITEEDKQKFFSLQGKRRCEHEFWAYDTTTLSSYSETLKQVQYGFNKEHDRLPQLNLTLVFGEESNLPFYYRKVAGNIPDSKTVCRLLDDLNIFGYSKVKLVMDRGFYSEENINDLYRNHVKFLISVKMSLAFIRKELDPIYDSLQDFENYNDKYGLYCKTVRTVWHYSQERPYKEKTLREDRRLYIHYYYNIERATEDKMAFDRRLNTLKQELETGSRVPEHEKLYLKYFICKTTPKRGTKATVKEEEIDKAKRYFGFFSLITNETMDAVTALELYWNKDVVEKAFGNLKERLNMRMDLVSSEKSLDGKLFVQFVALIYLSYIKKQMQVTDLLKRYTLPGLLDKLDVIECFKQPGRTLRIGEMLDEQKRLYHKLEVRPPGSL
ncbi:MAG: IS1634 family transposase [Methanomicrobiales archaeon]|nr:IS1634 family transposase [Methanomicrobiales archaeon]